MSEKKLADYRRSKALSPERLTEEGRGWSEKASAKMAGKGIVEYPERFVLLFLRKFNSVRSEEREKVVRGVRILEQKPVGNG